jgi:hypothetical protein
MLKDHAKSSLPVDIRKDSPQEQPAVIPKGEARQLNEMFSDNWRDHGALFSEVKNTVIKANPNVHSPFNLRVGEPSPLGLFVESPFYERPGVLEPGKYALERQHRHGRSAILARAIFQDNEGRMYRDVDMKGVGVVYSENASTRDHSLNADNPGKEICTNSYEGLLNRDFARYDYKMTEEFIKLGIGTCRVLGIIELQEIIATRPSMIRPWAPRVFTTDNIFELSKDPNWKPEKLSLEEAVDEGIIKKNFHPVIEVRAFLTRSRVSDLYNHYEYDLDCKGKEQVLDACGQLMLEDAMKLAAEELGLEEPLSKTAYLEWFIRNLARNVGIMHRNQWEHHYLQDGHNITLDGRMVDLDSVRPLKDAQQSLDELSSVKYALLPRFFRIVTGAENPAVDELARLVNLFEDYYGESVYGPQTANDPSHSSR